MEEAPHRTGRGGTNCVFLSKRPLFVPLPKRGCFDENGENDEFAFYPLKTRASLLRPPKTTKMTHMAVVTQAKAWFSKSRVCSSLVRGWDRGGRNFTSFVRFSGPLFRAAK